VRANGWVGLRIAEAIHQLEDLFVPGDEVDTERWDKGSAFALCLGHLLGKSQVCTLTPVGTGVDTVGLAFPVSADSCGSKSLDRQRRCSLAGGGFVATGVGGMAWVEASLPKRVGTSNVRPLEVSKVHEVAGDLVSEAVSALDSDPDLEVGVVDQDGVIRHVSARDPKVVRLDLVRDFQLEEPRRLGALLDGLALQPQGGRAKVQRFSDGRSGRAETLRVGPGAWAATLYDKHVESRGHASVGHLRAEFRLRSRQLGSKRAERLGQTIRQLSDVSETSCEVLRRYWWDMVGFGRWVGGVRDVWDVLAGASLSDREKVFFVGWYEARKAGRQLDLCDKTERRYRRVLAELELARSGEERIRLNYELGHEEVINQSGINDAQVADCSIHRRVQSHTEEPAVC
jgi:hypothetical protein